MGTIAVILAGGELSAGLSGALRERGHVVVSVPHDGRSLSVLLSQRPEAVLLLTDALPCSPPDLCRSLRRHLDVPIVVVAGRASLLQRADVLEQGADAILSPGDTRELLLRIAGLMTAYGKKKVADAVWAGFSIPGGAALPHLSPMETSLLSYLFARSGEVVAYRDLNDAFWTVGGGLGSLRVHIQRLRKKFAASQPLPYRLATLRGKGYRLLPLQMATGPPAGPPAGQRPQGGDRA